MKKRLIITIMAVLLVAMAAGSAQAEIYFGEDMEAYTVGTIIDNNTVTHNGGYWLVNQFAGDTPPGGIVNAVIDAGGDHGNVIETWAYVWHNWHNHVSAMTDANHPCSGRQARARSSPNSSANRIAPPNNSLFPLVPKERSDLIGDFLAEPIPPNGILFKRVEQRIGL